MGCVFSVEALLPSKEGSDMANVTEYEVRLGGALTNAQTVRCAAYELRGTLEVLLKAHPRCYAVVRPCREPEDEQAGD